jgi:hypothetical protein
MRAAWILVLVTGCWPDADDPAKLDVAIQRDTGTCWETIDVTGTAALDAAKLELPGFCDAKAAPSIAGGVDRLRVVTVYNLDLESDATVEPPALTLRVDGVEVETAFAHEQRRTRDRLVVLSSFYAPVRGGDLGITISAGAGLESHLPSQGAQLALHTATLRLTEICDEPCTRTGGVGTLPVEIALPSHAPATAMITTTLGGVPQAEGRMVALMQRGDEIVGRDFVPVPASTKSWQLTARVGDLEQPGRMITLVAPAPAASLIGCASTCDVTAGSKRTLRVVAPREIVDRNALVSTYVNGVPALVNVSFPLGTEDLSADTVEGVRELDVPAANATWQIDVRVSGFPAPSLTPTVVP